MKVILECQMTWFDYCSNQVKQELSDISGFQLSWFDFLAEQEAQGNLKGDSNSQFSKCYWIEDRDTQ